jgi:hypothetical protein
VQVFLGDYALLFQPTGKVWDGAAVGAVVIVLTEVTWGAGLFEHCMER